MNKHLKTCLGQKKKPGQNETNEGEDVDIRGNLDRMSLSRPDIFGTQENNISAREDNK